MSVLRVCLVASSRFPVREPFAGGLEAHTYLLATELLRRGHDVSLFAAPGSEPLAALKELPVRSFVPSDSARSDVAAPPDTWMSEHHAYLGLMLDLARGRHGPFDVVHNNSLHHLPVAMARMLPCPLVTTLHTPPIPWLESAVELDRTSSRFVAVSAHTARAWRHLVDPDVALNGIDTGAWCPGPGGDDLVWFGRIVPEKGLELAVAAARRSGRRLVFAGPVHDRAYYREVVEPALGHDVVHLGHLSHAALRDAVGRAAVCLVTPRWDEPYGLVAAEAMSCGTPVAAVSRGALPEIVDVTTGRLAADDPEDLARAVHEAATLDRDVVRATAVRRFSVGRMVDDYEDVYRRAGDATQAA